ncbi:MAG: WbqC family protein [Solirubrobacteraceae bacterium]
MQPTYLPWSGYVDLIDHSDAFVFLDTVAFSRQSWQQRNRISTPQGPLWLTVPVQRHAGQPISEVAIDNARPWRRKHWTSLEASYRRAPFWLQCAPSLRAVYERQWTSLADLNMELIRVLCRLARVDANPVLASTLEPLEGGRDGRLVEICRRLGGHTYLSPLGALAYLHDDSDFAAAGIELAFQNYRPQVYPQQGHTFNPQLSVIDALMNNGPETLSVIRAGRRPSHSLAQARAAVSSDTA